MILWTIHPVKIWEKLREKKILRADGRHSHHYHREAYRWMAQQMKRRLTYTPSRCTYPFWAWYQYDGIRRRMPDLRSSGHLKKGTAGVRIELEMDEREVLLSDFMDWHCVLNCCLCSDSEEELDRFDEELEREGLSEVPNRSLPLRYRERIEESWENIFDLDFDRAREGKAIQATFWELRLNSVREVRQFISR